MINAPEKILELLRAGFVLHKHRVERKVHFSIGRDCECAHDVDEVSARMVIEKHKFLVAVDAEKHPVCVEFIFIGF